MPQNKFTKIYKFVFTNHTNSNDLFITGTREDGTDDTIKISPNYYKPSTTTDRWTNIYVIEEAIAKFVENDCIKPDPSTGSTPCSITSTPKGGSSFLGKIYSINPSLRP